MAKSNRSTITVNAPPDEARDFFAADLDGSGTLECVPAPAGRGTRVTVSVPDETLGYGELRERLRGIKQRLETGENPTNAHAAPVEHRR
jgi:hypothetical protein